MINSLKKTEQVNENFRNQLASQIQYSFFTGNIRACSKYKTIKMVVCPKRCKRLWILKKKQIERVYENNLNTRRSKWSNAQSDDKIMDLEEKKRLNES